MSWRSDLRAIVNEVAADELADLVGELARGAAIASERLHRPPAPSVNGGSAGRRVGRYLKPAEVAERLSISEKWVYRHAAELGAVKLGGCVRIPECRLALYLKAHG